MRQESRVVQLNKHLSDLSHHLSVFKSKKYWKLGKIGKIFPQTFPLVNTSAGQINNGSLSVSSCTRCCLTNETQIKLPNCLTDVPKSVLIWPWRLNLSSCREIRSKRCFLMSLNRQGFISLQFATSTSADFQSGLSVLKLQTAFRCTFQNRIRRKYDCWNRGC